MKKVIILFGFLFIGCFISHSQDLATFKGLTDEIFRLGLSPYEVKSYKEIQGSPYLNPEMQEGKIITSTNKVITGKLRYNVYTDEIEFEYKNRIMSFAKPDNLKDFFIENQKIRYVNYIDGSNLVRGFMLIITEGSYTLMIKKKIVYVAKEKPQPYTVPKPDRFEPRDDVYYLSYLEQPSKKVISLKKLLKAFPELEPIVKNYGYKKVDFGNVDELKRLVEYINAQTTKN